MKTRRQKTTKVKSRKAPMAARRRASTAAELQKQLDQRLLSRYWVDTAAGVELIMTHRGANIAYLARATGLICGFMLPAQNCFITAPQWE
jgi:hypothetical protein